MDYVRSWIQDRERRRTVEQLTTDIGAAIGTLDHRAVVVVSAIDHHHRVDQPTWILDWVGLFEGADADERRSLIDSRDWEERIQPDLLEIRNRLQEAGEHQLLIRTVARQAVIFLVGFHLRRTAQFDVTFTQRGALWSSIDADSEAAAVSSSIIELGEGDEIAVVSAVSQDVTADVTAYLMAEGVPVGTVLAVSEASGLGQMAVTTPRHGASLATALVEEVRQQIRGVPATRIHAFFAGPGALAGLIGHSWNAMPPTVIYEHLGGANYEPTLEVKS